MSSEDPIVVRETREVTPQCGDIWLEGDLVLGVTAIAGAAMAFILNQAITMRGRRRKRREETNGK